MEQPVERPLGRKLGIAAHAVLVAAVSAFAVGGSTATAGEPGSSPAQTQPVQDSQATPTPERGERGGPGGREDCPEKDGSGQGGSQQEDQSTAPDASTESQEL